MAIDVNPTPDTSPEDQETLRKVYQTQLDEYMREHHEHATTAQELTERIDRDTIRRDSARRHAAVLEGKADELRRLAARDGITLT